MDFDEEWKHLHKTYESRAEKRLLKKAYFEGFCSQFSDNIVVYAENSARAVLSILNVVSYRFDEVDLHELLNVIERGIHSADFPDLVSAYVSPHFADEIQKESHIQLIATFFDYYWSRFPILFKCTRIIHKGSKRKFSDDEFEVIERCCWLTFFHRFPTVFDSYQFSGDFSKFNRLSKWYVRKKKRDDALYESEKICNALGNLFVVMKTKNNVSSTAFNIIRSSFPLFWDTLLKHFSQMIMLYANLRKFEGDKDFDEIFG